MSGQLPLALRWPAHQRFATFTAGANGVPIELVRDAATSTGASLYLSGAHGSGRTHLLIAACAEAGEQGRRAQYLPLRRHGAGLIRGFGGSDLIAIDDVDAIAGDAAAEHALFDLYNRCRAEAVGLLFAAGQPPAQVGFGLPDLVSRLGASTQAVLKPLDEAARRELVVERARVRGIELDDAVTDWLFAHGRRDLGSLLAVLDRIDRASLAARRRVTVPFLRGIMQADDMAS
ncbi:MAG: DnaA regulatory inactivator Hda [Xanthomonadales bacterium]|nr:DnaA regulatory inactivator Hda [Xanthomonadales bacterium]